MKKFVSITLTIVMALATSFIINVDRADAVPAFARQMQMSCKSCHFQHFPKLNAFGRAFKAHGYTDVAVDTIDGDWGTSLPVNLNLAWLSKIRYIKNTPRDAPAGQSVGDNRGSFQVPDEGVLWVGGRVAEHIGAAIEVASGDWANGTIVFGHDLESIDTHVGLAVWSGDGPFWGKELFNTGLIRGARGWENRDLTQAAGINYRFGSWEGVTAYAYHDWFFAAMSATTRGTATDAGANMSGVYRFALTPPAILGFEPMVGVYGMFGQQSYGGTAAGGDRTIENVQLGGIDFQLQGNITEGITLELLGNFLYESGNPGSRNLWTRGGQDMKAYQVGFDLGLLNDRLIAKFNYLHKSARGTNSVSTDTAWKRLGADIVSLGAYFNIRENVSLRPEVSMVVGGTVADMTRNSLSNDTEITIMLMYAF